MVQLDHIYNGRNYSQHRPLRNIFIPNDKTLSGNSTRYFSRTRIKERYAENRLLQRVSFLQKVYQGKCRDFI